MLKEVENEIVNIETEGEVITYLNKEKQKLKDYAILVEKSSNQRPSISKISSQNSNSNSSRTSKQVQQEENKEEEIKVKIKEEIAKSKNLIVEKYERVVAELENISQGKNILEKNFALVILKQKKKICFVTI